MGNIQKRPNGKWRARYRDDSGREHARHFERKADAQRWLNETTADMLNGRYVHPRAGRVTFAKWFEEFTARQLWSENTATHAHYVAKSVPFADRPLSSIRRAEIERWVKGMSESGPRRPNGLAPKTIQARVEFVRAAMRAAVADRLIPEDPTAHVKLPRNTREEQPREIPSPAELGKIIDAAAEDFRAFIQVMAYAGLRPGEASGLQLRDVDFLRRVIHVERQIQGDSVPRTRVCLPKYGSKRDVYVPAGLMDVLAAHVERFGVRGDEGWLFTREGHPYIRRTYGHLWANARAAAGLSTYTPHACRHFYASGLIAAGADVVTVQRSLGHKSPTITLRIYAHEWPTAADRTRSAAAGLMDQVSAVADSLRTEEAK